MKRILIFIFFVFIFSACNFNETKISSNTINEIKKTNFTDKTKDENMFSILNNKNIDLSELPVINFEAGAIEQYIYFNESYCFFLRAVEDKDFNRTNSLIIKRDFKTNKEKIITDLGKYYNGSSTAILNDDNTLVFAIGYIKESVVENSVATLDINTDVFKTIYSWQPSTPMCQIVSLNNNNIILSYSETKEFITKFIYEKLNIKSGELTKIIEKEFNSDTAQGEYPFLVYTESDKVHIFNNIANSNNSKTKTSFTSQLETFDLSGTLLYSNALFLDNFLNTLSEEVKIKDQINSIYIYKSYLVLITRHNRVLLLEKIDNEYKEITLPITSKDLLTLTYSKQSSKNGILAFYSVKDFKTYIVDLNKKTINQYETELLKKYPDYSIKYVNINLKGNLLYYLSNSTQAEKEKLYDVYIYADLSKFK